MKSHMTKRLNKSVCFLMVIITFIFLFVYKTMLCVIINSYYGVYIVSTFFSPIQMTLILVVLLILMITAYIFIMLMGIKLVKKPLDITSML